jgi:hypothetical protein
MKDNTKNKASPTELSKWVDWLEGFGVGMRIFSFGMLSIMGADTPFLLMWIINTIDAVLLVWCANQRGNRPYILLNTFWLVVGLIGIWTSMWGSPFTIH